MHYKEPPKIIVKIITIKLNLKDIYSIMNPNKPAYIKKEIPHTFAT